jgi:hypothetical protein
MRDRWCRRSSFEAAGLQNIALDCEAAGFHRYSDRLSLVQLTAGPVTFLLDPLSLDPSGGPAPPRRGPRRRGADARGGLRRPPPGPRPRPAPDRPLRHADRRFPPGRGRDRPLFAAGAALRGEALEEVPAGGLGRASAFGRDEGVRRPRHAAPRGAGRSQGPPRGAGPHGLGRGGVPGAREDPLGPLPRTRTRSPGQGRPRPGPPRGRATAGCPPVAGRHREGARQGSLPGGGRPGARRSRPARARSWRRLRHPGDERRLARSEGEPLVEALRGSRRTPGERARALPASAAGNGRGRPLPEVEERFQRSRRSGTGTRWPSGSTGARSSRTGDPGHGRRAPRLRAGASGHERNPPLAGGTPCE